MKKITVFGASGRVGKKIVEYALEENFLVTAFVRNMNRIEIKHTNLNICIGDVFVAKEVEKAIENQDIILSCLSGRSSKPDYSVLSVGMMNIITSMNKFKVKRILNLAGAGILDDLEFGLRRNRPKYPEIFKLVSAENLKVLELLKNSNVEWTMVCVPEMPEGNRTGSYRTKINFLPEDGSRISVEDVADFMIKNLENENLYRTRIGLAY